MADKKIINATMLDAAMAATADKIRAGTGKTDKITWKESNGFADDIPAGVEQAVPIISIDGAGKITASATQTGGIVQGGTKEATEQLPVQAAKTVTPTTTDQTAVEVGKFTTGAITVKGDANLLPKNILKGVSIFGVAGAASQGKAYETGSFVPEADTGEITIQHNLGVEPTLALFYPANDFDNFTLHYTVFGIYIANTTINQVWHSNGPAGLGGNSWLVQNSSATSISFNSSTLEYCFKAGAEYRYILLG